MREQMRGFSEIDGEVFEKVESFNKSGAAPEKRVTLSSQARKKILYFLFFQ